MANILLRHHFCRAHKRIRSQFFLSSGSVWDGEGDGGKMLEMLNVETTEMKGK